MTKDESPKISCVKDRGTVKNEIKIQGAKGQTAKTFLGCDTCKLKHNVPLRKTKVAQETPVKVRKPSDNGQAAKKPKIKLTDLCDEDKKRIVELMEELSKFAERNRALKESLDASEKAKQEQQECLMKQTNLHLEEKNLFIKEIQTYKSKLEECEADLRERISKWEMRERFFDNKICYFAKALEKSVNEKRELVKEIGHLKTCLKQSLESFELLSNEVATLQRLSVKPVRSSSSSRYLAGAGETKETCPRVEESEDEYLSLMRDNSFNRNSLEIINGKLEELYALLQSRAADKVQHPQAELRGGDEVRELERVEEESERSVVQKEDAAPQLEAGENKISNVHEVKEMQQEGGDTQQTNEPSSKFLKPFNECDRISIQAERLLKKIEKPFAVECYMKTGRDRLGSGFDRNSGKSAKRIQSYRDPKRDAFLQGAAFDVVLDDQLDEDRLLSELFYSDAIVDLGVETALMLAAREKYHTHPVATSKN